MTRQTKHPGPADLCAACGFCCNGVIFANVKLQLEDNVRRLRELGLQIKHPAAGGVARFSQPCACHEGCRCRIYPERPSYCRGFDCLLLKSVSAGSVDSLSALRLIRRARKVVAEVRRLLVELGDEEEQKPLAARFRHVRSRLETSTCGAEEVRIFGCLTLAFHNLNLLLAGKFYSG